MSQWPLTNIIFPVYHASHWIKLGRKLKIFTKMYSLCYQWLIKEFMFKRWLGLSGQPRLTVLICIVMALFWGLKMLYMYAQVMKCTLFCVYAVWLCNKEILMNALVKQRNAFTSTNDSVTYTLLQEVQTFHCFLMFNSLKFCKLKFFACVII